MESLSLLFQVFWSPGSALFKVAKNRKVLAPLVLLSVVGVISVLISNAYVNFGEMTVRMMEQQGRGQQMSEQQRTQMISAMSGPLAQGFAIVGAVVFPTVTIIFITAVYFGIFTLVGREAGFKSFLAVTAFAWVPSVVRTLAATLTVVVVPQTQIMLDELGNIGPAVLMDRSAVSPKVFAAVAQLDVVSLWILALLVIGYQFVLRKNVSVMTRAGVVFSVWLVYGAFRVLFA